VSKYLATYVRLVDYPGENLKKDAFLERKNRFIAPQNSFKNIPGNPVAYWVSKAMLRMFKHNRLEKICDTRKGLATSNNTHFLRYWHEVSIVALDFNCTSNDGFVENGAKWYPHNKGGEFRRWYGNNDFVINWHNNGYEIKNFRDCTGKLLSRPQNLKYNFKKAITWTKITSSLFSARISLGGALFDDAAAICYTKDEELLQYILGFLNSKCCQVAVKILNPTMNIQIGDIGNLPINYQNDNIMLKQLIDNNISLSRIDWDSFETSWDFKRHPLV
jgi:hypothetical protein